MWVAAVAHWMTDWEEPKSPAPALPVLSFYEFIPLDLNLDRWVFARPPPEVAYVL